MADTSQTALIEALRSALGPAHVLAGEAAAPWASDWTGSYRWQPLAVARPSATGEVAAVLRLAADHGVAVVPVGGNTGLSGGTRAEGALMLSLDRMNRIREIRADARVMVVEAGAVLADIQAAADEAGLVFPLSFGARGSARIGGALATNAGGANVLRHGSARQLCLGLEVVLASGAVLDLMSAVHKDNTGLDLRDLFIGSEGTLGVITAAVLKLVPRPLAHATAMIAAEDLPGALRILNRLQEETGGLVEAFEYMPRAYIEAHLHHDPQARAPFDEMHEINILVELGATAPRDARPGPDGAVPVVARLEEILVELLEEGLLRDAVVARNEAQRHEMWARREAAADLTVTAPHLVINDIAVPLDLVATFLERADRAVLALDPGAGFFVVAHLGDGNVHYNVWPSSGDAELHERLREAVEDVVADLRGSFSAEHGIGTSKLGSMQRRKPEAAIEVMARLKQALDPGALLNPGKMLPPG